MKLTALDRRKFRIRNKLKKFSNNNRFRLSVSRTSKNISAQIIDDKNSATIVSASSNEKSIKILNKKNKSELSEVVAESLAKKAIEKKITKIYFDRITKVVKGGRRFGFSALVVVGNQNGKIGIAHAKAKQVPDAIKKANELARRNLIQIPLREGRTIHHDIYGKDGAGKIKLRAAPKGTGIIAGGPVRAVCEVLGIRDIVAKSLGTANPHNVIRACLKALLKQNSPKNISLLRNKKISEIIEKRG
jgi:small subunit ribosomal protein S5